VSDFHSAFWPLFVTVGTVAAIVFCAWLLLATSRARVAAPSPDGSPGTTGHVWDGDLTEYNNPLPRWWRNLFWITIVFGVAYLVLYPGVGMISGTLGWTSDGAWRAEEADVAARVQPLFDRFATASVETLAADPEARAMGERLFLNNCAQCHGSAAVGGKGFPNLTDRDWLYGGTPEAITASITSGRLGVMPAFGPSLGEEGVREVASYVRSLSGLPNDGLRAQLGKPRFMENCAACHGADGKGNIAVGAPNLTDATWLYGSNEATIMETIRQGRHTTVSAGSLAMPSFKDTLGEARVHLLTAYVWGLSNRPAAR
jgi:cytochrome c oxidase cbb3-type subunit 3